MARFFNRLTLFQVILISLVVFLSACGDVLPTATPPPAAVTGTATPAGGAKQPAQAVISEKDNGNSLQFKVGQTILAGFSPELSWNFQVESDGSIPIIKVVTESITPPSQARFDLLAPGGAKIKAEGSCKPEPGKLCHQAIFQYVININISA